MGIYCLIIQEQKASPVTGMRMSYLPTSRFFRWLWAIIAYTMSSKLTRRIAAMSRAKSEQPVVNPERENA